jgi:16S rRNA (adenine1518-N6/adenine1519-N6)-dimethyltransferase
MPRPKLGQHFLYDARWRERIAETIRVVRSPRAALTDPKIDRPYCWIEIGAGHGEMTEHLVKSAVPVFAIELDRTLVSRLQGFAEQFPNLTIVPGDVLQMDLAQISAGRRIRLYGNLPYYITSPILHGLFQIADQIDEIHILIQLEVAERLAATPGSRDYGYLSVLTQYFSQPSIELHVPPSAFRPPPEVDSALVTLNLPGDKQQLGLAEDAMFLDFVKTCFAQKRKTLLNNLRPLANPAQLKKMLALAGLSLTARAEELSVAQLAALFGDFQQLRS